MAALGTATINILDSFRGGRLIMHANPGKRRRHYCSIVFGDNVSTYPANGVLLPAFSGFGLVAFLETVDIQDATNQMDGYVYEWDSVHNTVRILFPTQQTAGAGNRAGVEVTTAFVPATNVTLFAFVWGW